MSNLYKSKLVFVLTWSITDPRKWFIVWYALVLCSNWLAEDVSISRDGLFLCKIRNILNLKGEVEGWVSPRMMMTTHSIQWLSYPVVL